MSEPLSRRDFFAFLASPLTRTAHILRADEQRRRNLYTLQQAASTSCARCHAPFSAQGDETLCPFCRDAEAKTRALIQDLFPNSPSV